MATSVGKIALKVIPFPCQAPQVAEEPSPPQVKASPSSSHPNCQAYHSKSRRTPVPFVLPLLWPYDGPEELWFGGK